MAKLGGALIGYGIRKKNGEEKKVIFDKPIHNTITKSCLNNLLTFDGTNATPTTNLPGNYLSLFVKSAQASERYGVFNSAALGDGTGETSVNDTELKHRITNATSTKKTGFGWCGSRVITDDAILKIRIAHTHTIRENFTVKEIGWYNQKWQELVYSLSARVQLDEGIQVESGDEFYSIYELTIQFQDIERFSDFAGLGVSGYKVNGLNGADWDSAHTTYSRIGWPMIDTNGIPYSGVTHSGGSGSGYPRPKGFPVWCIGKSLGPGDFQYQYICKLNANWNKLKPFGNSSQSGNIITDGTKISNIVIDDYVQDTFRRDASFVLNPDFFGTDTYGILINGTFYRFGTFDEQDNFTPTPITINSALKITFRQSWSTDLLTPAG
jgi:hypothetical protein